MVLFNHINHHLTESRIKILMICLSILGGISMSACDQGDGFPNVRTDPAGQGGGTVPPLVSQGGQNGELEGGSMGGISSPQGGEMGGDETGGGGGGGGGGAGESGGSDGGGPIREEEIGCDIQETLEVYGCQNSGCHATPTRSSLRLEGEGFEEHMINSQATYPGCEDRKMIDPINPDKSLLLQSVEAELPPLGEEDTCQLIMPPGGDRVTEEHQACFRSWVHAIAARYDGPIDEGGFEPNSLETAVRKVKTLVNGGSPTAQEIAQVSNSPEQLRTLISSWIDSEAGQAKLIDFFELSLQQRNIPFVRSQFDRFGQSRGNRGRTTKVMEESFARTALHIVNSGLPFKQIATTRQWMVTTANLVLLLYPDQSDSQRRQNHMATPNADEAPGRLTGQVRQRKWHIPSLEVTCRFNQANVLSMLFGRIRRNQCDGTERNQSFDDGPLRPEDFEDWRLVTFSRDPSLSDEEQIPFYDLPNLRRATDIVSRLPRIGFFTTSSFFQNWATNVDNQFRVMTNQTLLTALHLTFSPTEPTEPSTQDGLDGDHADQPDCVGCHRQLDPMRLYFGKIFNVNAQLPRGDGDNSLLFSSQLVPSFGFYNETRQGGGLSRFANTIANHPNFASAWVQKLCLYANSQKCQSDDPEFLRLVQEFKESNLNFKELLINFFSSSLVTHLAETGADQPKEPIISITRRSHLCHLLSKRTGRANICSVNRVRRLIGLIPEDAFARGSADFVQPSLPSAFHFSAAESLCEAVATTVVTGGSDTFPVNQPEVTIRNAVSLLMGISEQDPRYASTLNTLSTLYERLISSGKPANTSLRSTFSLACLSPDVMGVGL